MSFLDVRHVYKHYGQHTALDDVSLSIERGRVFGLLGPNGAGKTSLIRIVNCITAPDAGEVLFDGEPLRQHHVERIGYLPEERGLYRKMKVGEQAIYLARLKGLSHADAKQRLEYWFDRLDIASWWGKRVEVLSKGMQQKVQFICTILHRPELLIFDEPFSGFDPVNAELLKREILELKAQGHTIIFSTHNMQSVEEICDDIALINKSRLVLEGRVDDIRQAYSGRVLSLRVRGHWLESLPEQVIAHAIEGEATILRIRLGAGERPRDLVARIPMEYDLIELREELPSMHEIFLKTVSER